jgi:catalase
MMVSSQGVPERLVDAQRKLAGPHPHFRPVHAKGIVCHGAFHATPEARRMSQAEHFVSASVPAVIRVSNSSGNPESHDGQPDVRGLAVRFQLAKGAYTDIMSNSIDGLFAPTPEEFLAFLELQLPDPATGRPDPDAVPRHLATHPAAKAFIDRMMQKGIPASYAQATYHAVHAFRFIAADKSSRFGRYHWTPDAGEAFLTPEVGGQRGKNFLREELEQRLRRGPAVFQLVLQLAADGDPTDDPTALWPANRPTCTLGRLEIASISPTSADDELHLVFDPTRITDGIELSSDPILHARSRAQAISFERRSRGV